MSKIDDIITGVIKAEGGYVDDPNDAGGKTKYGITEKVARENGYTGDMRDLPESFARLVYNRRYVTDVGFDKIIPLSEKIAAEVIDTGVNCGQGTAGKILQRCLNAFNKQGILYPDVVVDGNVGPKSIQALDAFLRTRKADNGEMVMMTALNSMQGAYYIGLGEKNPKNEDFEFGWFKNRVII